MRWKGIVSYRQLQLLHIGQRLATTKENPMNEQMMTRPRVSKWRLGLLSAVAVGLLGLSGMGPADAAPKPPVLAVVAGSLSPTSASTFDLAGIALSSRLGASSYEGHVQITSANSDMSEITDTLTETFTAPNGDTLTIHCEQKAVATGPGVYHGTDQWTVIGGTGRFAGATGSGKGDTYVDLTNGTFTKTLLGSITMAP
jgi:hypothetical protein